MNKSDFIKQLSEKLGYDEGKCAIINSVLEDHFIIGKNNKEKMLTDLMEKLGIGQEEANKIYNVVAETVTGNIKDRITGIFKKK